MQFLALANEVMPQREIDGVRGHDRDGSAPVIRWSNCTNGYISRVKNASKLASKSGVTTRLRRGHHMPKMIDLTGSVVGRLTVERHLGRQLVAGRMRHCWEVRCECGKRFVIDTGPLRDGRTRSCGCLRTEMIVERSTKHGFGGRVERTAEYKIWKGMRQRCTDPACLAYQWYGAKGVVVCDRWSDFAAFLEDMGTRPTSKHSIDRINPHGNYEPGNCRWATSKEQAANTRAKFDRAKAAELIAQHLERKRDT